MTKRSDCSRKTSARFDKQHFYSLKVRNFIKEEMEHILLQKWRLHLHLFTMRCIFLSYTINNFFRHVHQSVTAAVTAAARMTSLGRFRNLGPRCLGKIFSPKSQSWKRNHT